MSKFRIICLFLFVLFVPGTVDCDPSLTPYRKSPLETLRLFKNEKNMEILMKFLRYMAKTCLKPCKRIEENVQDPKKPEKNPSIEIIKAKIHEICCNLQDTKFFRISFLIIDVLSSLKQAQEEEN